MFWRAAAFFALSAIGLVAQPRVILEAVIQDQSGAPVIGARAEMTGSSGSKYAATTGEGGYLKFVLGQPGAYELSLEQDPFEPVKRKLFVDGRKQQILNIVMKLAAVRHQVTVTDSASAVSTDPENNADSVRLGRESLDRIPALDDDVITAASRYLNDSLTGASGATLVVDGMETDKAGVTSSAIQEVRINQNPYSAEFASPGSGRIEITTKQEATAFHGSFNFRLRDYHLDARNAFAASRPEEQRRSFEGNLSGPIGNAGKQSFLFSGERRDDRARSLIYAQTPEGVVRDQVATPATDSEWSARWNYRPSDTTRWSLRFESESESEEYGNTGGFNLRDVATVAEDRERALYADYTRILSASGIFQFRSRLRSGSEYTRGVVGNTPRLIVQDAFVGGSAQEDTTSSDIRGELSSTLAWTRTRHTIRAGVAIRDIGRRAGDDRSNRDGTFYFASLQEYLAGRPFSFIRQEGNGSIAFFRQEHGYFVQDDWKLRPNLSVGAGVRYDHQTYPADRNNVAPRLSAAWAPGKERKTVVRAGAGIFYDRMDTSPLRDVLRFDGRHLTRVVISQPGYPDASGDRDESAPPAIVRFARDLRSPYFINASVSVDRQIANSATLSIAFLHASGKKMFRSRDVNAPAGPGWLRTDAELSVVRQIESSARMSGRSLEISFRGDAGKRLSGMIRYRLGRTYNDTGGIDALPADSLDLSREWARADFDRLHRIHAFAALKLSAWLNLGLAFEAGSGRPYTMTTGQDGNRDGSARDRPAGVPRNSLQGPGELSFDVRWSRDLTFARTGETQHKLSFTVDAFNVINRVNYSSYVGNLSSPFFGLPVSARSARRIQLGVRYRF